MNKTLKYQSLIDSLNLHLPCPDSCGPIELKAFRWVKEDFSDGQSFLPNIIYDANRKRKARKNDLSDVAKCGNCALSFFKSLEFSSLNAEAIGGVSKVSKLLGYTHIASGDLGKNDGLGSITDDLGHFMLFEFEGIVLESRFKILQAL